MYTVLTNVANKTQKSTHEEHPEEGLEEGLVCPHPLPATSHLGRDVARHSCRLGVLLLELGVSVFGGGHDDRQALSQERILEGVEST